MSPLNKIQLGKIRFFTSLFIIASIAMGILLFKWQFVDTEKYLAIANERYRQTKIPSIRGSILASDGTTLAYSEPRFDAYIWLPELKSYEDNNVQTREEFIAKVSAALDQDEKILTDQLASGPQWIKIANKLTPEQKYIILDIQTEKGGSLHGVQFQYVNKRIYPEQRLASQVLGYVMPADLGDGYKGVWGLEQYWNGLLKPQEGYQSTEFDSFGNYIAIGEDESIEPKPGSTIQTTINKQVQAALEANLKKGVEDFNARTASGIIIDPKTGEILAMANYPDFDPNVYYTEPDLSVFGNLSISTPYEMGSVAKVFSTAAAIDLGRLETDTVILPNGHIGCQVITPGETNDSICFSADRFKQDKIIDCTCTYDKKPVTGPITVGSGLIASDNVVSRNVAQTMSAYEFYDYLTRFGVGQTTGIDLSGESAGVIKTPDKWNYADQSVYSFGQAFSMTPLEAIMGISAVANNGDRMQPYVVSKIIDSDNNVTSFKPKVIANVITPKTCDKMIIPMYQIYLNQLIENRYKQYSKYYIALKTGTSAIPFKDKAGYSDEINTTFAGFDASPDRKFAMIIHLEAPKVGKLSWANVRVVWLDTFIDIIDILKVQPYSPTNY